MSLVIADIAVN